MSAPPAGVPFPPFPKKLGILGGMGALASAELLYSVYRLNSTEPEQGSPVCLLYSDPSIPDRTDAILRGDTREVAGRLAAGLETLLGMGADRIVIACVTAHHFLAEIPEPLRQRVASLFDLMVDELLAEPSPALLLSTKGTRRARIFERHERWPEIEPWIGFLEEEDQDRMHGWLYRLKQSSPPPELFNWLEGLPAKYGRDTLIFGCTELHLLQRHLAAREEERTYRILDPLMIAARDLSKVLGV